MSPLSNSVYSSVFMYNLYVLTGPYRHLALVALIGPHQIKCFTYNIIILIVRFGDSAQVCRMDTPTSSQKQICPGTLEQKFLGSLYKPFNIMPFSCDGVFYIRLLRNEL